MDLTQEQFSHLVGSSREAVNKVLCDFGVSRMDLDGQGHHPDPRVRTARHAHARCAPARPRRRGTVTAVDIHVTFIGNATTLIRCGDITVLTDPNFLHQGQRAYLGYGLWSKRRHPPALTVDQLPPVQAVVLSHMHGDHWDRVAEQGLDHGLPIVTTPAAAKRLHSKGFHAAHGLDTWRTSMIEQGGNRLTVTALPGRHAPTPTRRLLPPVMGSMLEFGRMAGFDAVQAPHLRGHSAHRRIRRHPGAFDSIDAGILHLGGTRPPGEASFRSA